uniref:Uncharacterized protein n=1 Tax=Ditylum brightwellii TaxID=49249 RepID=A0A7S1Z5I1_9STRA
MKAAPISITDPKSIQLMENPGRMEDSFIFGDARLEDWKKGSLLVGVNDDFNGGNKSSEKNDSWERNRRWGENDYHNHNRPNNNHNLTRNSRWRDSGDNGGDLANLSSQLDKMSFRSASRETTTRITGKLHIDQEGIMVPPDYAVWGIIR